MDRFYFIRVLIFAAALWPLFAAAQAELGKSTLQSMKEPAGKSYGCLGAPAGAVRKSLSAAVVNPASLAGVAAMTLEAGLGNNLFSNDFMDDVSYHAFFSLPLNDPAPLTLALMVYGNRTGDTAYNELGEAAGAFSNNDIVFSLKAAVDVNETFSRGRGKLDGARLILGMGVNGIYSNIYTYSALTGSIDIGLLFIINRQWTLGFSLCNLGPPVSYAGAGSSGQTSELLPLMINVPLRFNLTEGLSISGGFLKYYDEHLQLTLTFAADIKFAADAAAPRYQPSVGLHQDITFPSQYDVLEYYDRLGQTEFFTGHQIIFPAASNRGGLHSLFLSYWISLTLFMKLQTGIGFCF